jgi:surfactin synthase thioesterase subunit
MKQKKTTLLCLPFAGAGASFFNGWKSLADSMEIYAVQLPGREKRFCEQPFENVHDAVQSIVVEVSLALHREQKIVIFGHSLGAVLAYEVARKLIAAEFSNLACLVVSGSPSPWEERETRASDLDCNDAFIDQVLNFSGYDHPALEDEMMLELLLPVLRADVRMHENYQPNSTEPLNLPIITLRGIDDKLVSADQLKHWQKATSLPIRSQEFVGGHMYFVHAPTPLLSMLKDV